MKKRILSLVLVLTIIIATSIPAFAATYSNTGSHTGSTGTCNYHTYATCTASSWNALIEWTGSTDSYTNYLFKTNVTYYPSDGLGSFNLPENVPGYASTRMGQNTGTGYSLYGIQAYYYVNNTSAGQSPLLKVY